MDDHDLQLLRAFRADEVEPPAGMQARIEERLWQSILDEEAQRAGTRRRSRWSSLLRPAIAAGFAVLLAVGVAFVSDGGQGPSSGASDSAITAAGGGGVLDQTASKLFGSDSAATSAAPVVGSIDLRSHDEDPTIVDGPQHATDGAIAPETTELADTMPRDPQELVDLVRASIADAGYDDPSDTLAFRVAMRWIVDPTVPTDLRAAMLRSLADQRGVDQAQVGLDSLGRQGIVLGHIDPETGIRTQVVLDQGTGTLHELRSFTTTYVDPACPPGTFTEHAAYADDGSWIDPRRQPWLDWPTVVAACGDLSAG